ncbi:hypothetical protein PVAND_013001 [Polypedilum vanderplanki]|uniref:Uncharacterized protein n=1 Tax=Polypedilum vanderplanki TaxID=319348 RepID=A0A9J6CP51_POLVA|nr:hypothetical protein PVAND_013001 [Polypedilum vanderplanki]
MEISVWKSVTQESSMHGVHHITDDKRNKPSKLFWCCVILASITLLFLFGSTVYLKFNVEPEIGLRVNQKSMGDLPLPAITICSPVFARDYLVNYTKAADAIRAKTSVSFTPQEQNYFAANSHSCIPGYMKFINENCMNRTDFNIMKLMNESALYQNEIFKSCTFRNITWDCEKLFTRIFSDYGYCYTFNTLDHNQLFNQEIISPDFDVFKKTVQFGTNSTSQWSMFTNYKKNQTTYFPSRALKINILGLYTYLNENDTANNCQGTGKVFPIILHMPNEIPTPFHEEMYLEFGRRKQVTLMIKTYKSTDELKKYLPEKRGCYFEGERQLKFFKSYTKAHCDFECMTNYTLEVCGCVKFSMPRTKGTPICDIDKGDCYYNAMLQWPSNHENSHKPCNCLETCSSIKYSILYERNSQLNDFTGPSPVANTKGGTYSFFSIRSRNHVIDEYENFAAYRLQNFVADFGGLLGLFLGCSIISLVELIYFCINGIYKKIKHQDIKLSNKARDIKIVKPKLQQFPKNIIPKAEQQKIEFIRALNPTNLDFYIQKRILEEIKK